jgi:kinesin family protein 2/24
MANNNINQPILESWVDFDLGEDVRDADRLLQDEKWQNATADGRVHLSHRENTFKHSLEFKQAIRNYYVITEDLFRSLSQKSCKFSKLDENMLRLIVDYAFPGGQGLLVELESDRLMANKRLLAYIDEYGKENELPFRICVRSRPLHHFEMNSGAYNCLYAKPKESTIILHDGRLARNDRSLSMKHSHYVLDRVWNEEATNNDICIDEIEPLVKQIENGNNASLILFGQTGTGKTYTLVGTLEYLSNRLIGKTVSIIFYEIHGKKCYDLLSNRKVIKLLSDEHEEVHVRGAKKVTLLINKYEDILNILKEALLLRSSEVTERNPISSRSHAVCTIQLINSNLNSDIEISCNSSSSSISNSSDINSELLLGGKITLVDLAGSERNYETTKMTAAMHRESAEINFALMALKDCFRCYHALSTGQKTIQRTQSRCVDSAHDKDIVRPPFRASLLTRVLRESFIINKVSFYFLLINMYL